MHVATLFSYWGPASMLFPPISFGALLGIEAPGATATGLAPNLRRLPLWVECLEISARRGPKP